MPLDQMVLLLLPSQSVLALPRPQLVNGRAVTISSGTAETAVCVPLSAAAHSEPHSQLVARLVSTRERAQALAAASAARQRQLRHCRDRGSSRAAREHEGASSRTLAARCAAREHEGASSGTRSCISRSSAAQLGSACAPTAALAYAPAQMVLLLLPCHDQLRHCRDRGLHAA